MTLRGEDADADRETATGMTREVVVKSPRWLRFSDVEGILHCTSTKKGVRNRTEKRDGTNSESGYNRASAVRRAQPPRHLGSKIGLGPGGADVQTAVDQAVDQRTDDFGAIQRLELIGARRRRKPIEVVDLPVEEDHRDLRPRLAVHWRPAGSGLALSHRR